MRRFAPMVMFCIAVIICGLCAGEEREVIFSDDFSGYGDGKDLSSRWSVFSGRWEVKDGTLRQNAEGYDHGLIVRGLYLRCDYSIQAKTRLIGSGAGAGFYWNLNNPETGDDANMLRLDGKGPMMFGYMKRRLFIRTGEPEGALMEEGKWHTIRLDVWNSKGTCDFYWDGRKIIESAPIQHLEGYVGLQCSISPCEFDDVKITVVKGTDWKAEPRFISQPVISKVTRDSAVVTWETSEPEPSKVWLIDIPYRSIPMENPDYSGAVACGDGRLRKSHRVVLSSLKPATQYTVSLSPEKEKITFAGSIADNRFVTLAPKGKMAYLEVPLAVLIYCYVTHGDATKPDGSPADPTIRDDSYYEQQVKYYEAMRYFYHINSMFYLDTKCKYLKVTRPVEAGKLGFMNEEVFHDLSVLAEREGLKPADFGAVIVVGGAGYYAYPWPTPWWDGSLNYTTGCCFVGGGDTWLGTHEFHHLTEGWMSQIGFPIDGEGGYGHADRPWKHPGRFGENYDFLAHTMRYIPPETYLKLSVGNLILTGDEDEDGVPDDESRLIFDEKRGGTSRTDKYSYKNGLNDLQNLTAGFFNPAAKGHKHPMLKKQINLKYPYAIHNYTYERKKKTPVIDGVIKTGEWDKFVSSPNAVTPNRTDLPWGIAYPPVEGADYTMDTYINWDDNYLYVAARAPYKFFIEIQLDAQADGYFSGKDNIRFGVRIPADESASPPNKILPPPGVMVWNNVEPVIERDMPNWTNELFDKTDELKWAWGRDDDGWYSIETAIPRCDNVDLVPKAGQEMGVRFWINGYLPSADDDPEPRYIFEMFEPTEYGYFSLVR